MRDTIENVSQLQKQINDLQDHVAEIEKEMNQMAQTIEKYINKEDAE